LHNAIYKNINIITNKEETNYIFDKNN